MRSRLASAVLVVSWLIACPPSEAADLTFDQFRPLIDGALVDPAYGDRIDAMGSTGFRYGGTFGLTTHVTVSYGPAGAAPSLWGTGYGSLSAVLYKGNDSISTLEVTLSADPGWTVVLHSFDLAAFASDFASFPVTISKVAVLDAAGAPLFESAGQIVSETGATNIAFAAPLEGTSLTIRLDLSNLLGVPAGARGGLNASKGIGIDNIRFSERGMGLALAEGAAVAPAGTPARVALADLDADAIPDLLVAAADGLFWSANVPADDGFGQQRSLHSGTDATGVSAGDFDSDGDLDVLASWGAGGEIAWYENAGGDFGNAANNGRVIATLAGASSVLSADIDRDGDQDVLATGDVAGSVVWIENDGNPTDGGWVVHAISTLVGGARHAAAADVDRDGDLDVLVAAASSPVYSWFENLGGGDFGSPASNLRVLPGSLTGGRWIGAADVDRDGDADAIVASCGDDTLAWYPNSLGTPTADFDTARVISAAAACPEAVAVGDLDQDGDEDLLVAASGGSVTLYRGNGTSGEFFDGITLPGAPMGGTDVGVLDLDMDGDRDVVAAGAGAVTRFENRANHRSATFPISTSVHRNVLTGMYTELAVADVDRDGDADLIAAERTSPGGTSFLVRVAENDGTGSYTEQSAFSLSELRELTTADVDGDGDSDLVAAHNALSWFANDGSGAFGAPLSIASGTTGVGFRSVVATDLDHDGDVDLVAGGNSYPDGDLPTPLLSWFESDGTPGDGGWSPHALPVEPGLWRVLDVAVDDLNRDGSPDIAATASDSSLLWYRGDATVNPAQFTAQPATSVFSFGGGLHGLAVVPGGAPFSLASATAQADADPDIVVGINQQVSVYENALDEPAGGFFETQGFPVYWDGYVPGPDEGATTTSLIVTDLNADGRSDVVATAMASPTISTFPVLGRNFISSYNFDVLSAAHDPRRAAAADVDGDGDLDFVTTDEGGDPLFVPLPPGVTRSLNLGGHYGLGVGRPSSTQSFASEGQTKWLLRFAVTLRAAVGDPSGRVEAVAVRFADAANTPLTTPQVNSMIETLYVYRGVVLGQFTELDPANDIPVATIEHLDLDPNGAMGIAIPPGDPSLLVAAGATFFVAAKFADGAASQPVRQLRTSYVPGSFVVRDGLGGSHLLQEGLAALPVSPAVETPMFISSSVTTLADVPDLAPGDLACDSGGGACTLRAAIQEANARTGRDEIRLGPGVYTLGVPGQEEDAGLTGDLDITSGPLSIIGAGPGQTIIDGGGLDRVFDVRASTLVLQDLTIRNGSLSSSDILEGAGGGIRSRGALQARNCVIEGNEAYVGGGIGITAGTLLLEDSQVVDNVAAARGGGIHNRSSSTSNIVRDSTIARNVASDGGGLANDSGARIAIESSTFSANQAVASAIGTGDGGGVWNRGSARIARSTMAFNAADTRGGYSGPGATQSEVSESILAGNQAGLYPDCGASIPYTNFPRWNLVQDPSGCETLADDPSSQLGVDPLLGPLQDNGGPTPTHALREGSPAIDAGTGCGLSDPSPLTDQRGVTRVDLPSVPNRSTGPPALLIAEGCDLGAYEVSLASTLPQVEVPIRWCAVEGSPSFDFQSPSIAGDVNALLQDRLQQASGRIWDLQSRIRFHSGATAAIPDFPILPDPNTSVGAPGDVAIDPPARDYAEFLQLIADCRTAWEERDPAVVGVTAVNINRFVDPSGNPIDILGLGGRAEFGSVVQQLDAGRVMVVDRVYRRAPYANPEDIVERVLAHELGHAAGSLRHGDGVDNAGPLAQCGNGIVDDDDDRCGDLPRFDGSNLMQYRTGTSLTNAQVTVAREHVALTIPDAQSQVTAAGAADAASIDGEFLNVLDWEFLNVLDFEFLNVLDWEFLNVLDFEFLNVLDFEENEILDFEFLNVLDFGMNFSITDAQTGDGETILYATIAGLPWPTLIRPPTSYFWYLDLDEDPDAPGSGDATGARPADYGFPGSESAETGVDVIVMLELYSRCDLTTQVCSDFVVETAFAYAGAAGYEVRLGPQPAFDAVQSVTVGLVQIGIDVEREDQVLQAILAPRVPNSLLRTAVPSYFPGDPVAMDVVTAIPCGATLPNGTVVDCQCTECSVCPDFPGCDTPTATPQAFKVCDDGATPCVTDANCAAGQACGGGKTCHASGGACVSNNDCPAGDFCGGATLLPADQPAAALVYEAPVFPTCAAAPPVATTREVTIMASDFPTETGKAMAVRLDDELIYTAAAPAFDPDTGNVALGVLLPAGMPPGDYVLRVTLEGFATTATCPISIQLVGGEPAEVEAIGGPVAPQQSGSAVNVSATFADEAGDLHTAEWSWGDGTESAGTITEPSGTTPGVVSGTHDYSQAGVYVVTLTLTDGQDNVSTQEFRYVVVYDAGAGFVTGGGHIDSPPGAYVPQPTLVGKAQFGFVSRYHEGESVPAGNTNFELKVSGLRFKSTGYEWLIVSGHVAQFTGSGTINGVGNYGFLLTAIDEALSGTAHMDGFRITIWDKDQNNLVVYDNRMGEAAYGPAATPIGGGSIVIHE